MALGALKTEADLRNWLRSQLEEFGMVRMKAVSGALGGYRIEPPIHLPVLEDDPSAESGKAILYAIENAGKVELRVQFPSGSPVTIETEA